MPNLIWFVPKGLLAKLERRERYAQASLWFYNGLNVKEHDLTEYQQVKFPRSKKRRVRKKWKKNFSNWGTAPSSEVFAIDEDAMNDALKPPETKILEYDPPQNIANPRCACLK